MTFALKQAQTSNGQAILQLNIAAFRLLAQQITPGLEDLQELSQRVEFSRNPKFRLELEFLFWVYEEESLRQKHLDAINEMINAGDRSQYWNYEPHLNSVNRHQNNRLGDVERIAKLIKNGK